jgi:hypothetical protein
MNTFKAGKLFCEKYNEVNKTNYTAKEIFCNVIAPLLFYGKKHLVNWTNSKFFVYLKKLNKNKVQLNQETFNNVVNEFCNGIENDKYGVMTTMNVFGGCAIPSLEKEGQTTMFCYSDNINFNYNERYYTFIGSIFSFQCEGWNIIINDKETIWQIYLGIIEYRKVLENNTNLSDKQVYAWNTAYLFAKTNDEKTSYIVDEFFKKDKLEINDKINFFNFLFLINKLKENTKIIELFRSGQYNNTCGAILINFEYVKRISELYKQLYAEVNEDFRYADFNKAMGYKQKLIKKAIENGAIYKGFFNPLKDVSDIKKNKFKQKYIELIMTDNEKKLAEDFAKILKLIKKKSKTNIHEDELFREKNLRLFTQKLMDIDTNEVFEKVIEHLFNVKDNEQIYNFLVYSEFKFNFSK